MNFRPVCAACAVLVLHVPIGASCDEGGFLEAVPDAVVVIEHDGATPLGQILMQVCAVAPAAEITLDPRLENTDVWVSAGEYGRREILAHLADCTGIGLRRVGNRLHIAPSPGPLGESERAFRTRVYATQTLTASRALVRAVTDALVGASPCPLSDEDVAPFPAGYFCSGEEVPIADLSGPQREALQAYVAQLATRVEGTDLHQAAMASPEAYLQTPGLTVAFGLGFVLRHVRAELTEGPQLLFPDQPNDTAREGREMPIVVQPPMPEVGTLYSVQSLGVPLF